MSRRHRPVVESGQSGVLSTYTDIAKVLSTTYDPVPAYLIEDILPLGNLMILGGEAGVGKSFAWSFVAGLAMATGTPVFGKNVPEPVKVLIFDQENTYADAGQYLRLAWNGLGCPDPKLIARNYFHAPFVLGQTNWAEIAEEHITVIKPEFIIFDTATSAFATGDENDNAEAAQIVGDLRRLQHLHRLRPTIMVLMHAKIYRDNGEYTIRGAKQWLGAVDGVLYLKHGPGQPRKDGLNNTTLVSGKTRAYGLRQSIHLYPRTIKNGAGLELQTTKSIKGTI